MDQLDTTFYVVSATLQLAAMFFAVRVAREVSDRRPWIILFASLFLMFGFRALAPMMTPGFRQHGGAVFSLPISLLLLIALFYIRKVAIAERESKAVAALRTAERDESENRYRSLVDLSPDVMFVNSGGKIVYANAAALKFFGADGLDDLLGRSPLEFTTEETKPIVAARVRRLLEVGDHVPPVDEMWMRLDGSTVPVEAAAALVPWHGGKAIQVILRDISERKRAEDEKTRLLASERSARSVAEHASRMKDEFLATLSHELRTPLTAILGWSQILRQSNSDANDLEQGLDTIERNARVQTRLIEDLLDMSRIISGKLRLDIQRIVPISFVEAAIETIRPAAEAKELRIEQILDPSAGPIAGDPNRLQQIVWNLLSNAIKFTPKGGKVQTILTRVNSHIEVTVADTGQGIKPQFLPYVFDRFRQADSSSTRQHGGLGIGLAIVKQLVELHGGTVRVTSAGEGLGTTVTVQLPLSVVHTYTDDGERLHPKNSDLKRPAFRPIDLAGVKVLIVDDEPDSVALIRRVLEDCDAEVYSALSARVALPILQREKPHVVVSDIGMPECDGYEFIRDVRSLPGEYGRMPAIALTAFARSEDRTRAMIAGYQVHISKPVEPHELTATIASLVGRTGLSPLLSTGADTPQIVT